MYVKKRKQGGIVLLPIALTGMKKHRLGFTKRQDPELVPLIRQLNYADASLGRELGLRLNRVFEAEVWRSTDGDRLSLK